MSTQNYIETIILAAGESSRMGRPKQLLTYNNETLLQHAINTASQIAHVTVVIGANSDTHKENIKRLSVEYITNKDWQSGMGSSLKAGLAHCITNNPQLQAVIIMVCDQPLITPQHLADLIQQSRTTNKNIVATEYTNTLGVPVLFKKEIFPQLLAINNTQGAKNIIIQNPNTVSAICFPQAAIDIDTPQDYQNLLNQHPTSNHT